MAPNTKDAEPSPPLHMMPPAKRVQRLSIFGSHLHHPPTRISQRK